MNIFKTFEIFLKEPLSILKKSIVQIVSINSPAIANSAMSVSINDDKTQINVINNDKIYNLLKHIQRKRENNTTQKLSQKENKVIFGALTLRNE